MGQHILILGGHGKIAQILTRQLLKKPRTIATVIRAQEQVPQIESLASGQKRLNVLVRSLEDIKSVCQAKNILEEVKPDAVVWSAGAGGKGGLDRTPSIKKFIPISYLACRRQSPSWWDSDVWTYALEMQSGDLSNYCRAKLAADEVLLQNSSLQSDFSGISLRPGMLSDEPAGQVELGKTKTSRGNVSRASVADTIVSLLENQNVESSWLDLLYGDHDVNVSVERIASAGLDAAEGEGN
ncbi:hypothetical protein BFJ70_g1447 [Fusarium oxysporum]|uniref:Uncharacterized protein n=1 Tax=Fusarium oxysporum Fo47 TaxID=660027 RepID=W9K2Y4_FUSOX|nr:hypothetical protein FOZG_10277 [Fusarium oxysporum Fo47]EWZ81186.1 hypothetical protein FOWG_14759 [Fusarium oxysporum f. sp. lycopersici MN25]RKL50286.1 hypothetical protein BFJ70_g1447 [Fusarium oxysporum]